MEFLVEVFGKFSTKIVLKKEKNLFAFLDELECS